MFSELVFVQKKYKKYFSGKNFEVAFVIYKKFLNLGQEKSISQNIINFFKVDFFTFQTWTEKYARWPYILLLFFSLNYFL